MVGGWGKATAGRSEVTRYTSVFAPPNAPSRCKRMYVKGTHTKSGPKPPTMRQSTWRVRNRETRLLSLSTSHAVHAFVHSRRSSEAFGGWMDECVRWALGTALVSLAVVQSFAHKRLPPCLAVRTDEGEEEGHRDAPLHDADHRVGPPVLGGGDQGDHVVALLRLCMRVYVCTYVSREGGPACSFEPWRSAHTEEARPIKQTRRRARTISM